MGGGGMGGGVATAMLNVTFTIAPAESVTRKLMVATPAFPGRPDKIPSEDSTNPAGTAPEDTLHKYGGVPPFAFNVAE